jgi:hypothetical protein
MPTFGEWLTQEDDDHDEEDIARRRAIIRHEVGRRRRAAQKFKDEVAAATKRCPKCREVKIGADFWGHDGRLDGLQVYCKECQSGGVDIS